MFAKWTRPHFKDDAETWTATELAPTLNGWEQREGGESTPPVLVFTNGQGDPNVTEDGISFALDYESPPSILSTEDSPARTSAWPANGPVLGASVAASGLSSDGYCPSCGQRGFALRMSLDFYPALEDVTSGRSSATWTTSGMAWRGRFWTHATSESRNAAAACSLSAVLETQTLPRKYWLSAKAAAGILRRAAKRGKELPTALMTALLSLSQAHTGASATDGTPITSPPVSAPAGIPEAISPVDTMRTT